MDKSVKISMLLEVYKNVLTERQADIADLYYNQNLSLSEIADEFSVSRQAVRKSLLEAEKNLFGFEEKLKIYEKQELLAKKIDEILKVIDDDKIRAQIEQLKI